MVAFSKAYFPSPLHREKSLCWHCVNTYLSFFNGLCWVLVLFALTYLFYSWGRYYHFPHFFNLRNWVTEIHNLGHTASMLRGQDFQLWSNFRAFTIKRSLRPLLQCLGSSRALLVLHPRYTSDLLIYFHSVGTTLIQTSINPCLDIKQSPNWPPSFSSNPFSVL